MLLPDILQNNAFIAAAQIQILQPYEVALIFYTINDSLYL